LSPDEKEEEEKAERESKMLATMIDDEHLPNQDKPVERNIYGGLKEKKTIFGLTQDNIKEQSITA